MGLPEDSREIVLIIICGSNSFPIFGPKGASRKGPKGSPGA